MLNKCMSLVGLFVMVGACWVICDNKKRIQWRAVITGIFLQIVFAVIILKVPLGKTFFEYFGKAVETLIGYTQVGAEFVFGSLADEKRLGFIFATKVLPNIIFVSALTSALYYLGILQKVVEAVALVMMKVMGTSGAESLAAAANIFMGQTEAPLVIKPYVKNMTRSELLCLMAGGMATIAGGVLAAYVGMGISAAHLLAASVMSAPAAMVCSKLIMPETEVSETSGISKTKFEDNSENLLDSITIGASDGMTMAINVAAMLLAVISLVALLNGILGYFGDKLFSMPQLTFELVLGYVFSPVAFLMGTPWNDCLAVGSLLGKKLVLNEFVAYLDLKNQTSVLSERAVILSTYALCGFSNFSSIAIQVGGIGVMAPTRRGDLARLGMKALFAGTVACLMTACVAGLFID